MLEGLEIGVVKSTQVLDGNYRLEAKFFTLKSGLINRYFLGEEILEVAHYNSVYGLNSDGLGCPVLRMNEFDMLFTGTPKQHSDKFSSDDIRHHSLKKDDILICRTNGNPNLIGKSALVAKNYDFVYESHLFKIRPKQELINSSTLVTYLNTKYGRAEINKLSMQGNQANFSIAKFKELRIPKFEIGFCNQVKDIVNACFLALEKAKTLYAQAETILLETLNLNNFTLSTDGINIKGFKESFCATGRLDAEYYQKKYEDYLGLIRSYPNGCDELQISCNQKDSNFTPDDKTEYKYIELADIGKSGEIKGCTTALGIELPSRARRKVNTNDVVISSIEGSLESCAMVTEEYNNALCSTGFYIVNSKKINSETLLVLFKSEPMQKILKQGCSGTILTAINKNEFQKIPVPLIDKAIQESIKDKLTESFWLKKQSEQLLETAKRAVEIAIEQDEDAAMRYIEQAQRASM